MRIIIDYDNDSDVLYMGFGEPEPSHTELINDTSSESLIDSSIDTSIWIQESERVKQYQYDHSVSVFDVCSYILKKLGKITTMKLQKLAYYCQAWSLVWDEEPLFKEEIEAWRNGPVIRELFYFHRGRFFIDSIPIGNPDILSNEQKETIDAVLDYYGNKSAQWLIDLSHMEEPWQKTREGVSFDEIGNRIINLDLIAEYYSSLPPAS